MKFDDILKRIGEFGRYQARLYVAVSIIKITVTWPVMIQVFLGASVDHWCAVPEWDSFNCSAHGLTADDCKLAKKEASIPSNYTSDEELEYAQCKKYNVSGVGFTPGINPANYTVDPLPIIECDGGNVYDTSQYKSSIVTDFDLVCGREDLTQISQMVFYGGYLTGSILLGMLSDYIGRWWTLVVCNTITLVSGVALIFTPNWYVFTLVRFFQGFSNIAFAIILYVIGTEFTGPSKRRYVMLLSVPYALGYMFLALPAYFIRNWRSLQVFVTVPQIFVYGILLLMPESARWLVSTGRYDEAEKVIKKIATTNKAVLPDPVFTEEFKKEQDAERSAHKPSGLDLFRTPKMRARTINLMYIWMVNAMVYHGLSLNSSNFGVNDYVAFALAGAVEIPAYIINVIIVESFGRKPSLCVTLLVSGAACLSTAFIPPGPGLLTVAMIGKFCVVCSFTIVYLYTLELYPTNIRGVAMGNCSMFSRIATMMTPLILILGKYWKPFPLIIYGVVTVIAGFSTLALPESRGQKLPETLEDGENFGSPEVPVEDVTLQERLMNGGDEKA